ncbi:MAG TPA: hypothetical protein VMW04_00720 [Patescibacteria group bacterium]|nr:hypothetical protein [Patescibacteria group bacterium]
MKGGELLARKEETREELLERIGQEIDYLAGEEGGRKYQLPTEETRELFENWSAREPVVLPSGTFSEYLPRGASFELAVARNEGCLLIVESNGRPVNTHEPVIYYELALGEGRGARFFCYSLLEERGSGGICVTDNCLLMFGRLLELAWGTNSWVSL